jgi:hypothetical protein
MGERSTGRRIQQTDATLGGARTIAVPLPRRRNRMATALSSNNGGGRAWTDVVSWRPERRIRATAPRFPGRCCNGAFHRARPPGIDPKHALTRQTHRRRRRVGRRQHGAAADGLGCEGERWDGWERNEVAPGRRFSCQAGPSVLHAALTARRPLCRGCMEWRRRGDLHSRGEFSRGGDACRDFSSFSTTPPPHLRHAAACLWYHLAPD